MSRDILNYSQANGQLTLVDYYARCSLASLGAQPIEMPSAVHNIGSKFQRRMVERDIRKDFLNDLARLQFDLLLLDLIDERFNLYVDPEGRGCTLSSELLCSGFLKDADSGSKISLGSEEFWRLWEAGWSILVNELRCLGVLDRLRVNQVFWASQTENGGNFNPDFPDSQIDSANRLLDRMYRPISADIPSEQFLRFDHRLMTGSISHKWGISPFHYVDEYYHAVIGQLCAGSSLKERITTSRVAMTSCANYPIDKVFLQHERNELVATVAMKAPQEGQFAFYVFRNGKRIHAQGYSPSPTARVDVQSQPGLYRILVFFLSPDGARITKYSNPVFLYPIAHSPGTKFRNPQLKVVLQHEREDVLVATAAFDASQTGQFSFYVFRNGKRIHTQWYSSSPVLRFCIQAESGLYQVLVFFLTPDGKTIKKYSNTVFLYPIVYSLGQAFKRPQPEERTLLLSGQYWKFPALYFNGQEQRRLFVMLTAAVDRSKNRLPVFNRWTWAEAKKFPGHVLCVADPTLELHDEMNLGWYLGTGEHDASEELSRFIRRFAEALGIPEDKIVIWGSSGGGFSALAVTSHIAKATAVAINAQTDVFAYEIARYIETVKRCCFRNQTATQIQEHFGTRINMAQAWRNNRSSRAILIQNKLDTHHYACHFKPFWEALGGAAEGGATPDGRHYAWLYSDSHGHAPESEQMVPEILNLIDRDSSTASTGMPTVRAINE